MEEGCEQLERRCQAEAGAWQAAQRWCQGGFRMRGGLLGVWSGRGKGSKMDAVARGGIQRPGWICVRQVCQAGMR